MTNRKRYLAAMSLGAALAFLVPSSANAQDKGPWIIDKSLGVSNACVATHDQAGGMQYTRAPDGFWSTFYIVYPKKELQGKDIPVEVDLDGGTFSTLAEGDYGVSLQIGEELQSALEQSKSIRVRHRGDIVFQRSLDGLSRTLPALRRCVAGLN